MGGSFESGAGDDPDKLFANEEESKENPAGEVEIETGNNTESEQAQQAKSTEATTVKTDQESHEKNETVSGTADVMSDSERQDEIPVMVKFDTSEEIDAAQLAREFIPDTYNKSHAWALGRDGVDDSRSEKKTFFLQSSVLDLEAICSEKVDGALDGHVPLTDLRELALILAYHQPELLAEAAREWGAESA